MKNTKSVIASTEIEFGNNLITISITEGSVWEKGTAKRHYYNVESSKANPLSSFYLLELGTTRDFTTTVDGLCFGYAFGFCESHKKKEAVTKAVQDLASQLAKRRVITNILQRLDN